MAEFARFLQFLHSSKRLSPLTIAGYKSAITHTVALARGVRQPSFSSSVVITNLLESFRRMAPSRVVRVPQWDLFVVLEFLRDRCEPLVSLSLQKLTFKTVFLLGLALASRVSGLHALSGLAQDIEFDDDSVTLHFVPEFRAKTQPSDCPHGPIRVPRLTNILCADDIDRRLCPVRALQEYLSRTAPHRLTQRRLFISWNSKYTRDISKVTVSRWLVETVKMAYSASHTTLPTDPIRAHEIRAISSSLALARGLPVERLLRPASWKRVPTFIHFYLRDFSVERSDRSRGFRSLVLAQDTCSQ